MMRLPGRWSEVALLSSLLFSPFASAYTLDCGAVQTEGIRWDLSKLGGPHSVMHSVKQEPSWVNTTWTIDICKGLEQPDSDESKDNFCGRGTRVCGVEHVINGNQDVVEKVIPVAGEFQGRIGALDPQFERLKSSNSHSDVKKEGVRITMGGGEYNKRKQKAIIEFVCNKDRTGEEGNPNAGDAKKDDEKESTSSLQRRAEDEKDGDKENDGMCMSSLSFVSYEPDTRDEGDILRLEWETKYACEDLEDNGPPSASWGFFTWFILIAFLGTAAYLIFGSWLNYNRYGARGWDLIPHGDTIRDVPYLLKDWTRRAMNTVQGGGSRGGYSAV